MFLLCSPLEAGADLKKGTLFRSAVSLSMPGISLTHRASGAEGKCGLVPE